MYEHIVGFLEIMMKGHFTLRPSDGPSMTGLSPPALGYEVQGGSRWQHSTTAGDDSGGGAALQREESAMVGFARQATQIHRHFSRSVCKAT